MNYAELMERIIDKYGSVVCFAKAFGCSPRKAEAMLAGFLELSLPDVRRIVALLQLSREEMHMIFLPELENGKSA